MRSKVLTGSPVEDDSDRRDGCFLFDNIHQETVAVRGDCILAPEESVIYPNVEGVYQRERQHAEVSHHQNATLRGATEFVERVSDPLPPSAALPLTEGENNPNLPLVRGRRERSERGGRLPPPLANQNRKRAESCMLRGGRTDVTAPKPVGFPVSEARLVGVGSMRPVDATNPRTLSVALTVSYCV